MALPKFTIHKYVKLRKARWRYKRATVARKNFTINPEVNRDFDVKNHSLTEQGTREAIRRGAHLFQGWDLI